VVRVKAPPAKIDAAKVDSVVISPPMVLNATGPLDAIVTKRLLSRIMLPVALLFLTVTLAKFEMDEPEEFVSCNVLAAELNVKEPKP